MIKTLSPILMAFIVFFLIYNTVKITKEKFTNKTDPKIYQLKEKLKILFNKENYFTGNLTPLNNRDILNEVNIYAGDESYTLNKKTTYMCLRNKKTGEYYQDDILMYVLLHELAHVINTENVGHTKEFNDIFEELLEYAIKVGIYDPSVPIPVDYCK